MRSAIATRENVWRNDFKKIAKEMIEMIENGGREGNLNSAELETCRSMDVTVFTLKNPFTPDACRVVVSQI